MNKDWDAASNSQTENTLLQIKLKCFQAALGKAKQQISDLYTLCEDIAPKVDVEFGKLMDRLADAVKCVELQHASLKDPKRLAEIFVHKDDSETFEDGRGKYHFACDIIRGTIVYETLELLLEGLEWLFKHSDIRGCKNRFFLHQYHPYRDVKLNICVKAGGRSMICELQLHTIVTIKRKEEFHKFYDLTRMFSWYDQMMKKHQKPAHINHPKKLCVDRDGQPESSDSVNALYEAAHRYPAAAAGGPRSAASPSLS